MHLAAHGPCIQGRLADAISSEPPSVTQMVRKLEAAGHVQRRPSPEDGRAILVELTDSGWELTQTIRELWVTLADETVGQFDEVTAAALAAMFSRLAENLSRKARAVASPTSGT